MRFTIIGVALALNLGAAAHAAGSGDAASSANASGGEAQIAAPVAPDTAADAAIMQAHAPIVLTEADAGSGDAQAPGPVTVPVAGGGGEPPTPAPGPAAPKAQASESEADAPGPIAIDIHGGTTGGGAQIEYVLNGYLALRVSGDWLGVSHSFNTSDADFTGHANWATVGAFLDLHPLDNGWFLSGGVFQGARNASVEGVTTKDVTVDGVTLTPDDIGTVMGEAKLDTTSPFVGLGWDQAQHERSGFTFRFLAGAAFGGAKLTLWDVGPFADTDPVKTWIAQEQAEAQSKADPWKAYPVIQLGLGYRF
jgi:hypothetical protein